MSAYIENLKSRGWDNLIVDIGNEFKYIREELCINNSTTTAVGSQSVLSVDFDSNTVSKLDIQSEESIKNELKKVREELNINTFSI